MAAKYELTPFSKKENSTKKALHLEKFTEREKPFYILSEKEIEFPPIRDNYRFGLIDNDDNYFWFFYGVASVTEREKAIEVFNLLLQYCKSNNLGTPFAYKEYEKRE